MTVVESRLIWAANRTSKDGTRFRILHQREGQAGHGLDWIDVVRVYRLVPGSSGTHITSGPAILERAFPHVDVVKASLLAVKWAAEVEHNGAYWLKEYRKFGSRTVPHMKKQPTSDLEIKHVTNNDPIRQAPKADTQAKAVRKPKFTFARH